MTGYQSKQDLCLTPNTAAAAAGVTSQSEDTQLHFFSLPLIRNSSRTEQPEMQIASQSVRPACRSRKASQLLISAATFSEWCHALRKSRNNEVRLYFKIQDFIWTLFVKCPVKNSHWTALHVHLTPQILPSRTQNHKRHNLRTKKNNIQTKIYKEICRNTTYLQEYTRNTKEMCVWKEEQEFSALF